MNPTEAEQTRSIPHENSPIALVTGSNRGIGLEVVRQLAQKNITVILTARSQEKGEAARQQLANEGLNTVARSLDVTHPDRIHQLAREVEQTFGRLDILVNNAGILYDTWEQASNADFDTVHEAIEANAIGAWRMCQAFLPLLHRSPQGRIVNVSSEAGSLTSMGSSAPAYSVSKAALNALTRQLAAELKGSGILVNSICPGWVATEMGGTGGRPIREGAAGIVWAATLPDDGPTGGFFRDGKPLPW